MKLSECTYGVIVQRDDTKEVGMVVGITNNISSVLREECREPDRAIPLVQWSCGITHGIHHSNLKLYKG